MDGNTYVLWTALREFNTPYLFAGHATFNIAGTIVHGVGFQDQTYINWASLCKPYVVANHINGGWNFTRPQWEDTATDGYKMTFITAKSNVLPFDVVPVWAQTFTSDGKVVPNQDVTIKELPFKPTYGSSAVIGKEEGYGTQFDEIYETEEGTARLIATWVDPKGVTHEMERDIVFAYPPSTDTPAPSDDTVITKVPIKVINDQVLFDGSVNNTPINWQLDTGAMMPLINGEDAARLNLPDLQDIAISGVTGTDKAYISKMNVTLGGVEFKDVECIVYKNYHGTSLFGFSFFADQRYDLLVSNKHNMLLILK